MINCILHGICSDCICIDTFLQDGKIPVRMDASGKVVENGKPRETREFNNKMYLMETAITGDIAILRAWKADEVGNCVFRYVCIQIRVLNQITKHDMQ